MITRKKMGFRALFNIQLYERQIYIIAKKPHPLTDDDLAYYLNELGGLGGAW
jgi:hypothetical protein